MMKLIIVDDGIGIENDDDNDGELLLACHKLCLLGSTQSLLRIPNRGTNQLLSEIQIQIQMQIHSDWSLENILTNTIQIGEEQTIIRRR